MDNTYAEAVLYSNIKCPYCGAHHFSIGVTECTALYCPPVVDEKGKVIHNDLNHYKTECYCLDCNKTFYIEE